MNRVLIEFNKDFTLMDVHANFSLSPYIGALENLDGTVFVSQPSIYDVEIYLERNAFILSGKQDALKNKLCHMFAGMNAMVDYVQN